LSFVHSVLRFFFTQLYTTLAWSYDIIAWIVSLGQWDGWTRVIVPTVEQKPILELGFGPGHLQTLLSEKGNVCFGVDPSGQMCKISKRNIQAEKLPVRLIRARAQQLPIRTHSIGALIATFPTDYIFDRSTIEEAWRVLKQSGTLSTILMAEPTGSTFIDRFARWIFLFTGETKALDPDWLKPFRAVGFNAQFETVHLVRSSVKMIIARKEAKPSQEPSKDEQVQ
jgi:ubiquinone/menaquinone biosynthesis C-methylase UbiE